MILDKIVADNRAKLEERKRRIPLVMIEKMARGQPPALDFAAALCGEHISIIAEVKKASPSRGIIRSDFDPVAIAQTYAANGAAAISVLTEAKNFHGSLDYLKDIRKALRGKNIPLLRKDFIWDSYQVYESRAYGADAVLFIAAMLTPSLLTELQRLSSKLGMCSLVEVHNETELEIALESGARIIGINNRDLRTFKVDLDITRRLRPRIPSGRVIVSESGIKTRSDVAEMERLEINGVLVGETLMASPDIGAKLGELCGQSQDLRNN